MNWSSMSGDEKSRYCEHCGLHVHNLSMMTTDAAQRLICDSAGRLCARFQRDSQGRVITLDYQPVRGVAGTWRFWTLIGCLGAVAAAVLRAALWNPPAPPPMIMGDIAMPAASSIPTNVMPGN